MEMFLLMFFIIMSALAITYSKEIYLDLTLVLGSLITDIKNKIDSIIGRK